jgi:hypothetical protein
MTRRAVHDVAIRKTESRHVMVSARSICIVVSALAIHLAACGGSDSSSTLTGHPAGGAQAGSSSSSGSSGSSSSSSSSGSSGTPQSDAGGSTSSGGSSGTPDAGTANPCTPYIGTWVATLDQGASVSGSDTNLVGGGPVPITGTINFTLSHDDADLPNILDFAGSATIKGAGITIQQALQPATSPTGDPKDTTCTAGALHFYGAANVNGIGPIDFEILGTLDTTVNPPVGTGPFTMKTSNDNGAALNGTGNVHFVRQ